MFYLEDYVEKLEYLPETVRTKLTKMGSIDNTVMMSMHEINKKVDVLFAKADSLSSEELETQFNAIMVDGEKAIQGSDDKIEIAQEMQDHLSKYIAGLDQELHKFKMELEADYSGITEKIEKRSLESEQSSDNINVSVNVRHVPQKRGQMNRRLFGDKKEDMLLASRGHKQRPLIIKSSSNVAHSSNYNPNHMRNLTALPKSSEHTKSKACSSPPPSTSQTSDTQQFSGNRSTNTSDESIEVISPDVSFGSGVGQEDLLSELSVDETKPKIRRKKKKNSRNLTVSTEEELTTDDDTTRYCVCNDVAYGTMVACDNKMCPHEWFHCECVGIKTAPKGKWYCPKCRKSPLKNRKSRKTTTSA